MGGSRFDCRSPRLSDLVMSRMRALPDPLRSAMEIVALGAPLPLALAEEAIGDDLGRLEERGFAGIALGSGERNVVPAHPLYGEILKEHPSQARSCNVYRAP